MQKGEEDMSDMLRIYHMGSGNESLFGLIVIVVTNFCIKHRNPEYALF